MAKNWNEMTLEQLEKLSNELDEKRLAIRDEMRALRKVIDAKLAMQSASEKLERLSDAERRALLQMVTEAGGIESLANVDGLGRVEG